MQPFALIQCAAIGVLVSVMPVCFGEQPEAAPAPETAAPVAAPQSGDVAADNASAPSAEPSAPKDTVASDAAVPEVAENVNQPDEALVKPGVVAQPVVAAVASDENVLKALAQNGDAEAQYQLGIANAQNPEEANQWLLRAAEQGNLDAQITMAQRYATGDGVQRNDAEAARWLQAAEQRYEQVQSNPNLLIIHSSHKVRTQVPEQFRVQTGVSLPPQAFGRRPSAVAAAPVVGGMAPGLQVSQPPPQYIDAINVQQAPPIDPVTMQPILSLQAPGSLEEQRALPAGSLPGQNAGAVRTLIDVNRGYQVESLRRR